MLKNLSISNFAIIDVLEVSFNEGMTSITGETGTGKSILLGALSLITGKRADLTLLKDPFKKCVIEASFDINRYELKYFFDKEDLDYHKTTILRRELIPSGKSRAFINDTPVNLDKLNKITNLLIDIHSQNDSFSLFSNSFLFKFLDSLSGNTQKSMEFKLQFEEYKSLLSLHKDLQETSLLSLKELDYNKFLLSELKSINLEHGILTKLEDEVLELSNIDELRNKLSFSIDLMSSDENGVINKLTEIINQIKSIEKFSKKFLNHKDRIESALIDLKDVTDDFENHLMSLEFNDELFNSKNSELENLYSILKKHNVSNIEDLVEIKEKLSKDFFDSKSLNEKINNIEDSIQVKNKLLSKLSSEIHDKRVKAIPEIENKLKHIVHKLGMRNATFKIKLKDIEGYNEFGNERLEFLFSSNLGSTPKPIKNSISGGEMSRIMLSIKYLISKFYNLPTIIFDEIDGGVSGAVANEIAILMQEMSNSTQVLTITHIPQVAAKGKNHIKVYKEISKSNTYTRLKELNMLERENEIASMLSGEKMTMTAKKHARELLD